MNFKVKIISKNTPYFVSDTLGTNPFLYTLTGDSEESLKQVQIMSKNTPYFLSDIICTNPFLYTLTDDSDKALKLDQDTAWKAVRNVAIEFILHSLAENMSFFIIDDNGKTQHINIKDLIYEMLQSDNYQIVKVG